MQDPIKKLRDEIILLKIKSPYDPSIAGKLIELDQLIEAERPTHNN